MSRHPTAITPELHAYLTSVTLREHPVLRRCREETATHPRAGMQISAEQGQLMRLLVELTGARRCLEVGVFTGYSSLSVALALPADGRIVACDVSEEYTSLARGYWREAGVEDRIDLRLGPATQTLEQLVRDGAGWTFDFAFIDADKTNYDAYYEAALQLLRPGGLLALDNTLWGGRVADPAANDADTAALKRLNAKIAADERVTTSLVTIGDGLTLCRKR